MDTTCVDCGMGTLSAEPGVRTEFYMVKNKLWKRGGAKRGCLCVRCLERRLGRKLRAADFTRVMMNDLSIADTGYAWSWRTKRLRKRIMRK